MIAAIKNMRLFKKERRRHGRYRAIFDQIREHEKESEEIEDLAKKVKATIDGDEFWMKLKVMVERKEEDQYGSDGDCVPDNNS